MDISKFGTIGVKLDYESDFCKRIRISVGSICNYNCKFCYSKKDLTKKRSFNDICKEIDKFVDFGFTEIDLSGGEPAIIPEFFDIIDYCKSKNVGVSCLSNGYKFADINFCKKTQEHGLNEILFSLHGSNELIHDEIVQHKGAFKRIIKAIENAKSLGFRVRINCTVTPENYKFLYNEYPKLINQLDVFEVNFIEVNYFSDNKDYPEVNLKVLTDAIKAAIDKIDCKLINVRYVPFCYMKGYEKNCVNYCQHIYDLYDWNMFSYVLSIKEYDKMSLNSFLKIALSQRLQSFYKEKECFQCKYFYICDGMKNEIGKQNKVFPESGKKINNINYFRKDFFK